MAGVAGIEMQYAVKKAVTWGTAVECGAGDGLLCLPTGIKQGDANVNIDDSQGLFWNYDGSPGEVVIDGQIPGYLRYDGLDLFLALFMGSAGVPVQQAATAAYAYTMDMADNLDGLFGTFVRHWKNYVEEIPSLKIVGLTLKGERGKPVQLIVDTIGDQSVVDGVNDATTFLNVTIPETRHRVQMSQGVFLMNDQDGVALSGTDEIGPSSFELTLKRTLSGQYTGRTTSGDSPRDIIDEPVNDGRPEVRLKLQFPKHTAATRLTDLGNDTRKKCSIEFTGANIADTYDRTFKLWLPHLQMNSVDVADETGIIKEPVEFICHGADTAPAGMTGITKPLRITGINQRTTDPLA